MREKVIERKLVSAVAKAGGLALKFVSPGINGVPDRLLLFYGGKVAFCEVKDPGEKPRPLQECRMQQLREMGFKVFVVDSEEQIREVISDVILRFETPGERASGSITVENGRQPCARSESKDLLIKKR